MLELDNATAAAKQRMNELEAAINTLNKQLAAERTEKSQAHGQIAELQSQLALEKAKADHHMRWAIQVTEQIHSIGMFANEAMRLARQEIAANGQPVPATRTDKEILANMERDLSATAEDLRTVQPQDLDKPLPKFLAAGPRRHV
jgi:hypothetical protein